MSRFRPVLLGSGPVVKLVCYLSLRWGSWGYGWREGGKKGGMRAEGWREGGTGREGKREKTEGGREGRRDARTVGG